jgi:prepilin peptidase dependent protein B
MVKQGMFAKKKSPHVPTCHNVHHACKAALQRRVTGFTITELMVAIALGLAIIGSVLIGYLATYSSALHTLKSSRLNQDLSALMSLMSSDIRRAGYNGKHHISHEKNPFNSSGDTALAVFDNMNSEHPEGPTGRGSCIVFAYDSDQDGAVTASELIGFRLNKGVVEMRTAGNRSAPNSCDDPGNTWMALTDPGFIMIDKLDFDLADSTCLNTREPDGSDNDGDGAEDNRAEYDCYGTPQPLAGSRDTTIEVRQISITLTGALTEDPFVRMTLSQQIRVRNDLLRQH